MGRKAKKIVEEKSNEITEIKKEVLDITPNEEVELKSNLVEKNLDAVLTRFDIEGKFLHIKVGDKDKPANGDDIEEINNRVVRLLSDNNISCAVLVTHHAVEIIKVE